MHIYRCMQLSPNPGGYDNLSFIPKRIEINKANEPSSNLNFAGATNFERRLRLAQLSSLLWLCDNGNLSFAKISE